MSTKNVPSVNQHPSSFRDPNGYIFTLEGVIYRLVQKTSGSEINQDYKKLIESGLYDILIEKGWLVSHEEVSHIDKPLNAHVIIQPEQLPFISYPWEWSFGQLQEAALLTLNIQSLALEYGMTLKDASAFNVTWHNGKPIFLDTLSFAAYIDGAPWQGYRQFCTHFLAPLSLMHHKDLSLQKLSVANIDGIPLELTAKLLPWRTRFNLGLGLHIHAHASSQKKYASVDKKVSTKISLKQTKNFILSLKNTTEALQPLGAKTEWGDYYNETNYTPDSLEEKKATISTWIKEQQSKTILDLGSNDGTFSRIAAETADLVISADIDQVAVHANYLRSKSENSSSIIPMLLDITNPSPAIGWHCKERTSVFERLQPDLGLALALVHHLVIGANIPLDLVVENFADIAPNWIIEFVDKPDSQVQRLLANREDIFTNYTKQGFEETVLVHFAIKAEHQITNMHRTLYSLKKR